MPDSRYWTTPRLLSTAARLVAHAWNEQLAAVGLTHAGVAVLEVLVAEGPMSQARLAAEVRVQTQTMSKTLTRLQAHGHVTRAPDPQDRRILQVAVTDLGKEALLQARELERNMTLGGEIATQDLRDLLATIIRRLGSARWDGPQTRN